MRSPKALPRDVRTGSEGGDIRRENGVGGFGYVDAHLSFVFGRRKTAIEASAFDAVPIPVVVVDGNFTIICLNRAAERLIAMSDVVDVLDGRLVSGESEVGNALAEMVSTSLSDDGGADSRPQRIEVRHGGEGEKLRIRAAPLADALNRPSYVAVSLTTVRPDKRSRPAPLERFGLTAAEARVAEAIAKGYSVQDTSRLLNISPNTARKYLQIVFQKVGVRRQVDLVRLVLAPSTD